VAAALICVAAEPVSRAAASTLVIRAETSLVPAAACSTLREISEVAADCCSTAAAIAALIAPISVITLAIPEIARTASSVPLCTAPICPPISSVALAVWLARFFTSLATTANPLPASPARAASIVAFNASRLVWLAMSLISATTVLILVTVSDSLRIRSVDCAASTSARSATLRACSTRLPISVIDADNCSAALATVCELVDASSAALATEVASVLVAAAFDAICDDDACN